MIYLRSISENYVTTINFHQPKQGKKRIDAANSQNNLFLTRNKLNEIQTNSNQSKNLIKIVSTDIDELDEQLKAVNFQFQPKNFYDNYRNMYMIKAAADKSGFSTRADIKNIVKYLEMQTVSQLYIQEQVEKKIKITDEDVTTKCRDLREKDPRMKSVTLDRCLQIGRGVLKQEETQKILPKVLERVKEGISIKHNDKFDLEQYLKTGPSILKKDANTKEKESEKTEPKPTENK